MAVEGPAVRDDMPDVLQRVFAPLHKMALGLAVGLTAGVGMFALTAFHVIASPPDALNIGLLSQYFYGYDVTWQGAFVGFWWALVAGFAAAWFMAFLRNLALAIWMFVIRTRAELSQTSDFLDHI
jgi:hypothetical protein